MTSDNSNFELPIRFQLSPSKWLIALIYLNHSGALICIGFSNVSILLIETMCLIVLFSLAYWHYKMIYLLQVNHTELLLNDKDEWFFIDETQSNKEGDMVPVALLPESFVHTHLIVLVFKQGRSKRMVILTPDNISQTICRRLRVRLRFNLSGVQ